MRIPAVELTQRATWSAADGGPDGTGLLALGVWTERRPGLGEDAEPLLVHERPAGRGLLAVFDGAGGAGAGRAGRSAQGAERTGAWLGARIARAATEEWYVWVTQTPDAPLDSFERHLSARMSEARGPRRKIIGSMLRELPTTVAALSYATGGGGLSWRVFWAGDSRCYLLDDAGLQQLSRDDTESDDALVLLVEDPPMTNLVSADRAFRINTTHGGAALPAVLLCATDGFFGYVDTPAEFEHVLLDTLMRAADLEQWSDLLAAAVGSYTGDDASLALLAAGYPGFEDLRARFEPRARLLAAEHREPVRRAGEQGRDTLVAAREDSWRRYRPAYERRMPGLGPEAPR